jgi:predicted RNase H-like nuclease (RuvC/YqgF family)
MPSEIPEFCPQPDRPCQWERERADLRQEMREMRVTFKELGDKIADIHQALAVGSERFKSQAAITAEVGNLEKEISTLTRTVDKLSQTVGWLRTIVFGGVGLVLVSFAGVLISMAFKS